jgi:two-component system cell cycle sensor histidine kinase/response regulator CckA
MSPEDSDREIERLGYALEVAHEGLWDWDLVSGEVYCSRQVYRMLGYVQDELSTDREAWERLLHPEDRAAVHEQMDAVARGEADAFDTECRLAASSGEWRWIRCRGRAVERGPDGQALRIVGTHTDITGLKQVEEALRRSEERYRTLVESQGEGIGIVDEEERFVFANLAAERIFGLAPGGMIGRSLKEFMAPEQFQKILEQTGRRRTGLRDTYEMSFTRADGETRTLLVTATPRVDSAGGYAGAFGVFRDITDRKQAEEALRESEERYRQLIESLPHAVGVLQHGRIVFANRAAVDLLGCASVQDLFNREVGEFVAASEQARIQQLLVDLRDGTVVPPLHFETRAMRMDGGELPVEVFVSAITHRGEPALQLFVIDISERLQADAHRVRLEEQLLQARKLESIGRLAGGIAHEFNNLLTPVILNAHMALQELSLEDPRYQDFQDILQAATRAKELTRQLLAFGRRQLLQVRAVDLNRLVNESFEMLRRLIREDVEISLDLARPLSAIRADPSQIQQVLVDLVLNARDAMPGGGRIVIRTANEALDQLDPEVAAGPYVLISVSDTGHGMDAETVSRIFDPFYSTKETGRGAGLGLATVHGIIKQHGGHILVNSVPGRGSEFKVFLPAAELARRDEGIPEARTGLESYEGTILVVEDEPLVRQQVCRTLRRHGFRVLEAQDGDEALALARRHAGPLDVLLADVIMPRMNGVELSRRLLDLHPRTKVVYMSGYADDVVQDGLREDTLFLAKPFSTNALLDKVRQALNH